MNDFKQLFSNYRTSIKGKMVDVVSTWEQNSNGDIRNVNHYKVKRLL